MLLHVPLDREQSDSSSLFGGLLRLDFDVSILGKWTFNMTIANCSIFKNPGQVLAILGQIRKEMGDAQGRNGVTF